MIKLSYNQEYNAIIIEFIGNIDAAQGEEYFPNIPNFIPKDRQTFNLLVDLSLVESIDPKIRTSIKKAMDLFNKAGVAKIIRVIPRPDQDIGLNIMSYFHYSKSVQVITLPFRQEAEERLRQEKDLN